MSKDNLYKKLGRERDLTEGLQDQLAENDIETNRLRTACQGALTVLEGLWEDGSDDCGAVVMLLRDALGLQLEQDGDEPITVQRLTAIEQRLEQEASNE